MYLNDLLTIKGYTIYQLSKESGIPKTTLFDIFNGNSNIKDCRLNVVLKLIEILHMSIDELLSYEQLIYNSTYEKNIPEYLKDGLENIKKRSKYHDIYLEEFRSIINVCEVEQLISSDQANYFRKRYLR